MDIGKAFQFGALLGYTGSTNFISLIQASFFNPPILTVITGWSMYARAVSRAITFSECANSRPSQCQLSTRLKSSGALLSQIETTTDQHAEKCVRDEKKED